MPHEEQILVVRRATLFPNDAWQGIKQVDFDHFLHIIEHKKEFHARSDMEVNPTYKQIIPYLVFKNNDKYFVMLRTATTSEQRLKNKYSLGIGGHIRKEDMTSSDIFDWAKREFHEEVSYNGNLEITPLGVLNDDSNDVGKVHVGFVFLLEGDSDDISVKSELKSGQLMSLQECDALYDNFENWSKLVVDMLQTEK